MSPRHFDGWSGLAGVRMKWILLTVIICQTQFNRFLIIPSKLFHLK
jgi:hypothetical protein